MNIGNKLKVAITILVALVAGFLGYRVMRDLPLFRQSMAAKTYFEKTDGLTAGNYIFINGVKIGSVKGMNLTEGDSVEVNLNFNLGVDIPKNSVAYLKSSGLLDGKAIVIKRGNADQDLEYGGTLKGVYSGGIMETLSKEGQKLGKDASQSFDKLNSLLQQLNETIDDTASQKIDDMLTNLESASNQVSTLLREKKAALESSITHANNFLANVDTVSMRNKSRVDSVMVNLDQSLNELKTLSRDLNQTNSELNRMLIKINNGEGTLGKLVNDPSLYNNLDKMSSEMGSLIKNINENPRKYLKNMHLIEVF